MDSPPLAVEAVRTLEFYYYARLDHLTKLVCTPLNFDEYYTDREDRWKYLSTFLVFSSSTCIITGGETNVSRYLLKYHQHDNS